MSRRKTIARRHRIAPDDPTLPDRPNRPDADITVSAALIEIAVPDAVRSRFPTGTPIRCLVAGECSVIVTTEPDGLRRFSIAHPSRYPTWDEIAAVRYRLFPDVPWMAMYLPPRELYVNIHKTCFYVLECPVHEES